MPGGKPMSKRKKRIAYGMATIMLFIVELLIALFVHDNFIRPYVGDVLRVDRNLRKVFHTLL